MQKPGQISVIIWTGNTKQRWVTNEQNKQAAAFDNFQTYEQEICEEKEEIH